MIAELISRYISERLLRQVWRKQDFISLPLRTQDGREVEIISIGTSNPNGGPDFLNAQIKIGKTSFAGDVELHRRLSDWTLHDHHSDPKYNKVILHVVFYANKKDSAALTKSNREVPTLILETYLSKESLESLHNAVFDEKVETQRRIKCVTENSDLSEDVLLTYLKKLSLQRLEYKVRRFEERLKELVNLEKMNITEPPAFYSADEIKPEDLPDFTPQYVQHDFTAIRLWDQMLYEFIMEALGYLKNQSSFLRLARNANLKIIRKITPTNASVEDYEAILFGASGLISFVKEENDEESKNHLRKMNKIWNNYSVDFKSERLNCAEWQFFRLRPENFPTLRIAAAAFIIERIIKYNMFKSIIQILKDNSIPISDKIKNIYSLLLVESQGFWKKHYRFGQKSGKPIKMLIGKDKALEIIINTIIPLCLLYARTFKKREIRTNALNLFSVLTVTKRSSLIDTLENQLIKGKFKINTAVLYQGLVQLYKYYCVEEKCSECEIGKNTLYKKFVY